MLFNISWLEWVGYAGSVIVAVSLTMSSIKKLRWYNLVGAAVFSFYGFAIGALPVGLLNLFISLTDVYYIIRMYSQKESFQLVKANVSDEYLNYFIDFYQSEIKQIFPHFSKSSFPAASDNSFILLLLRNAKVAGVFMGVKSNDTLTVHLDFVTAEYRDLKPGDFIYRKSTELIKSHGINTLQCQTDNVSHRKYLTKMGFVANPAHSALFEKHL